MASGDIQVDPNVFAAVLTVILVGGIGWATWVTKTLTTLNKAFAVLTILVGRGDGKVTRNEARTSSVRDAIESVTTDD